MALKRVVGAFVLVISLLVFPQTVLAETPTINSSSGTIGSVFQTPSEIQKSGQTNEQKLKEKKDKGEIPKTDEEATKEAVSGEVAKDYATAVTAESSGAAFIRDLTYANYKDDLKYFTSKVYFKGDFFGLSAETNYLINSFVQGIFWVNKELFSLFASAYEAIQNFGAVDTAITMVIDASADIFNTLATGEVITVIGAITVVYALLSYAFGRGSFFKILIQFFLIYAVTLGLFSKAPTGDYYLTRYYNNVTSVFNNLATSVSGSTQTYSSEGTVLDSYFQKAIWQPYAYMNADKTDTPAEGSSLGLNLSDDDLKALLAYEQGDGDFTLSGTPISSLTKSSDVQVKNLTNNWGTKFSYAIGSIVNTIVMGIAIDFFGLVSFALKALLLILFAFAWFYLAVSLIPRFAGTIVNFAKKIIILGGLSGFMTFIAALFLYLYNVIENAIMQFTNDYLLAVFLKVLVLWIIYKQRDLILGVITGDKLNLTAMGSDLRSRFSEFRRKPSRDVAPESSSDKGFFKMSLAKAGATTKPNQGRINGAMKQKASRLTQQFKAGRLAKKTGLGQKQALAYVNAQSRYQKDRRQASKEAFVGALAMRRKSGTQPTAMSKPKAVYQAHQNRLEAFKQREGNKQRQQAQNQALKADVLKRSRDQGISPKEAYKQYSRDQRDKGGLKQKANSRVNEQLKASGKRNPQKPKAKKSVTTNRFQEKHGKHYITATGNAAVAIGGNAITSGDIIYVRGKGKS
ncbi:hypothetical protein [Streptococcus gallolyticus]|uniref:TrbL/VirB6 plasmid conjugal transfer protein n=1 Tax=Streptococcus gallolyticus TaxID=315405 RepID=A0A139R306_9STRE|nr:hypothetical protein [Streptococcus gallolyticus]KXT64466.1 hypothetical protein SGADD02_02046 [Streptococcus gallolyticus]KXU09162.1 hypothetical protein SGADD03_01017 [Streptococcus gallolyticus]